jgi:hypothetical protein
MRDFITMKTKKCELKLCKVHGGCEDAEGECIHLVNSNAHCKPECIGCDKFDCHFEVEIKEKKMKNYQNNYNVRDAKGRFTKTATAMYTVTSVQTLGTSTDPDAKEKFLAKLRTTEVMVTYEHNGSTVINTFTLKPDYLTGYVGKGSSKRAPSNLIYAYDVDEKRFKAIDVTKVSSFIPL